MQDLSKNIEIILRLTDWFNLGQKLVGLSTLKGEITLTGIQAVFAARRNILSYVRETPVFQARSLEEWLGFQLFLKAENLQKTGSFKIRGAANFLLRRMQENPSLPGVVAASSGNHGQAVACVAGQLGIPAVIVMPEGATRAKVNAALGYGAQVEFCGRTSQERLQRARELAAERNYVEVPPYDHADIMAGQGTLGAELVEQLPHLETVYVPIGGGGLISGVAVAIKELRPDIRVIGAEPAGSNAMYESRRKGERVRLASTASIADGLLTLVPGDLTFPMVQKYVDDIVLVEEAEIRAAMALCLERFKLLPEPSGAVSIAAACKQAYPGKQAAAVVSGGNVDLSRLAEYLSG